VSGQSKGWESIGSLRERRKENTVEAKPWVGETLKTEKKPGTVQKMAIFRDEVSTIRVRFSPSDFHIFTITGLITGMVLAFAFRCNQSASNTKDQPQVQRSVPDHHVREAVNPRTGRRERVFVNLEAVYPDYKNPSYEISFEELRATSRGWMQKDWRSQKTVLKEVSGNATGRNPSLPDERQQSADKALAVEMSRKLTLEEKSSHQQPETVELQEQPRDGKAGKARKIKVREIGETQTSKHT